MEQQVKTANPKKELTMRQMQAVSERHKTLLVSAAAGAGKTTTLTRRVIASLLDESSPVELSRMLIATFTVASAADLRDHVAKALTDAAAERPDDRKLSRRIASLGAANICTLDSYFQKLLRAHAQKAGMSPDFRIADTAESELLRRQVMNALLSRCFDGKEPDVSDGKSFASLCALFSPLRFSREALIDLFLSLDSLCVNFPQGAAVLGEYAEVLFQSTEKPFAETVWGKYIVSQTKSLCSDSATLLAADLRELLCENEAGFPALEKVINDDIFLLKNIEKQADAGYTPLKNVICGTVFGRLPSKASSVAPTLCEDRDAVKKKLKSQATAFFSCTEAEISETLSSLARHSELLCRFLSRFSVLYGQALDRRRLCDFASLESRLLGILTDKEGRPTDTAKDIAASLDALYIDEYQDINPIQHRIIEAISRPDNRFMVGDVKQSIYSFRRADPSLFTHMKLTFPPLDEAKGSPCASLSLSENFRSDGCVIDFINRVFDTLFGCAGDSIGYRKEDDRLICGSGNEGDGEPHVFFIRSPEKQIKRDENGESDKKDKASADDEASPEGENEESLAVLSGRIAEARTVASQIKEVLSLIDENGKKRYRPCDIAILLRTGNSKAYLDALREAGLSGEAADDRDFFLSPEILLALSLLNAVDNPFRDIYLASVMLSPLFCFTVDELADIRVSQKEDEPLWISLKAYTENHPDFTKGADFIERLSLYRSLSETVALDRLVRRLYNETGLLSLSGKNGSSGRTNLLLLYEYARRFQKTASFAGLHGFIDYLNRVIESKKSFERPKNTVSADDCVRIMTIHSSKGLEFPVCFVCGCGAPLTGRSNRTSKLLLHPSLGTAFCLPDKSGFAILGNPIFSAVSEALSEDECAEELRVLYVAMTRAKQRLYLSATPFGSAKTERVLASARRLYQTKSRYAVLHASNYFELLVSALGTDPAKITFLDAPPLKKESDISQNSAVFEKTPDENPALTEKLTRRFSFVYPYAFLHRLPEKLSVSRLSPSLLDGNEEEISPSEAFFLLSEKDGKSSLVQTEANEEFARPFFMGQEHDAAERGIATHLFLQFCDFTKLREHGVESELSRLGAAHLMNETDLSLVRKNELEAFRASPFLDRLLDAEKLQREFRFHVALPAVSFSSDPEMKKKLGDRKVLVQGIIDCLIETKEKTIELVDYKTDRLTKEQLACPEKAQRVLSERHSQQLAYYREAVKRIYGKTPTHLFLYSLHAGKLFEVSPPFPLLF